MKADILLVDDLPANLLALEAVLDELGQNLVRAKSGEDALRQLQEREFAVVLLDVQMPGLSGFETAQRIRADGRTRHTPIIFITAFEDDRFPVERAYELGAVDYLVKPLLPVIVRAKVRGFVELFRNAAEIRRLRQLERGELEHKLAQENARLRERENALRETERRLREQARRKDEWLAMLAHELRNPLAPVFNSLHLLKLAGRDPAASDRAWQMLERQLRHLARLVDDLLDVSRLTRGRVQVRTQRLDLAPLIRTAAEDRRATLAAAGLTLLVQVPETPAWVLGDATRLTQIIGNLLDNSANFTDRGGTVQVLLTVDPGHRQAVLAVRDTGVGFDPELIPRLFEAFTQARQELDPAKGGLGLGLTLVKGLAELHGGEVQAASEGPGKGAEFTVRLPLEKEPAALAPVPAGQKPAEERVRVLVIEDCPDSAHGLRLLLESWGHEVAVAFSGPEGVKVAGEWRPEVVLCDLGLPGGLDGYAVARTLRQDPGAAKVRLVAVSGYTRDEDRLRSLQAGFDFHLGKPVDPEVLRQLLGRPAVPADPTAERLIRSMREAHRN